MSNSNMKIIMVAPVPPPYGGIGNWVLMLDEYVERQESITLHHINTAPASRGLDGRSLWDRVVKQGLIMLRKRRELVKCIRENKPDAVHITTSGQLAVIRDILMLKTIRRAHVRSVYHIRFGRIKEIADKNTIEWKLIKKAFLLADQVIAIDSVTHRALCDALPKVNVTYIPNPINTKRLSCVSIIDGKQIKEIVFIGWVVKTKGIEELLSAWQSLSQIYPDWSLCIIGPFDTKYKDELEAKYSSVRVSFEGELPHSEAMSVLAHAEIFAMPTYTEGFPNVILEAMAYNKAIVASSVGAIPDMLSGDCGIVIDAHDVDALKNALNVLMNDNKLRAALGTNAKQKLERCYTMEKVFPQYIAAWRGEKSSDV